VSSRVSDTILARLGSCDRDCRRLAAPIALPDPDTGPGLAAGSGLRRLPATGIGAIVMTAGTGAGLAGCRVRAGLDPRRECRPATGQYPDRMATIKTTPVIAASTAPALEVTTVTEVITRLAAWLRRLPPPQERIGRLLAELQERFAGRTGPITQDACAEIERVAWPYSRHLLLHYDRDGAGEPDEEDPGWPEPDPGAIVPRAAQVRQVSRLDRGACLIRIDGFRVTVHRPAVPRCSIRAGAWRHGHRA